MPRYVALLQGINVGGKRIVRMAGLRATVAETGGEDVATYVQSGNVVFTSDPRSRDELRRDLERRISAMAGFDVWLALRDRDELAEVVARNPFPDAEPAQLLVGFLEEAPPADALASLDPAAFAPEAVVARGREVYLHLPNGAGRSKLPAALGRVRTGARRLPGTTRNWRTVTRLLELAGG